MLKFIFLLLFSGVVNANSCVVLLYHHFANDTPKSTSISPELFEKHLQYLQQNSFKVLPLSTMLNRLKSATLPDKCVVLTADDAYISIAKNAYPLLKKYQMSMAVFVPTDAVEKQYKRYMSWQQMQKIQGENMEFYNHSLSHPHLLDLDSGQVLDEIKNAQKRLRKHLKVTAKILAYPYGEANLAIMQSVKNLDYTAFGQHSGVVSASSNWQNLPRFPMAANYAKMPKFREKVNALPMPLVARKINPIFTQNPPTLKLEFPQALSKQQKSQFMCFVKGGVNMVWSGNKSVKITAKKRLKKRRSKYNCTFPSGQKGRFYWHSVQWINPKIAE